jgi:dTDP-glucose 4,6-dehydratase
MKQRIGGETSVIILRPFNTFGPYQSAKAVIPELIVNCLRGDPIRTTGGEQTREFNYVDNIIDGLILAAEYNGRLDGVMNLASGEEVSIRDLVERIARLTGTNSKIEIGSLPYRPTEIWRMFADSTRARKVLGWEPKVGLDEGLKRTVEWFRHYSRHTLGE